MKIYKVKVNGKVYEVELESVTEEAKKTIEAAPAKVDTVASTPVKTEVAGEGCQIKAPMQGTINKVCVAVGDRVSKGTVVCVLEAMKMENDIQSPVDGTVKQVLVNKGQNVNNAEIIIVIG